MDDVTRRALLQLLGKAMSDISEECYCADWVGGTEYFVPELCRRAITTGQTQFWGHGEVTPELARGLIALAELIGSWADLDEARIGYVPYHPFPVSLEYAEALEQEQSYRSAQARKASPP
jgi:hypothetical protein